MKNAQYFKGSASDPERGGTRDAVPRVSYALDAGSQCARYIWNEKHGCPIAFSGTRDGKGKVTP